MDDRGVLHVDAASDGDFRDIAAHDGVEPEAGELADLNLTGDRCVVGEEEIPRRTGYQIHGGGL
jgi:hypothetical protein